MTSQMKYTIIEEALKDMRDYISVKDSIAELEDVVDQHDCTLMSDGWCRCMEIPEKLRGLKESLKK